MKTLLCAIGKLENHYIREWITHHLNIGFDKIVIIDNNDTEGEFAENIYDVHEVIKGIEKGVIEIVPEHNGTVQVSQNSAGEIKCYNIADLIA